MSGMGGLLGMGGGASGSGFSAPQGVNPQQLNTAYDQTQTGIKQQQDFVNALQLQNGLGNQSQVFNQLNGVANGTGPNPAQAMLANSTGANVANQAAMMAGQRGASANTGLMARQVAQTGAGIQQNAAGQAAALQAQQSLNAMNSMGNIANTQVGQMQQGLTGLNQNSLQQQANLMGLQANQNSANASLAGASQGAQGNMMGNMMGAIGSVGNLFGSGGGGVSAGDVSGSVYGGSEMMPAVGGASDLTMVAAKGGQVPRMATGGPTPVESQNVAPTADANPQGPSSKVGQMFNNYTSGTPAPAKSGGGGDPLSGVMGGVMNAGAGLLKNKAISEAGNYLGDFFGGMGTTLGTTASGFGELAGGAADSIGTGAAGWAAAPEAGAEVAAVGETAAVAAKGGRVPALVSPGEKYLKPRDVDQVKAGANPMAVGEKIPGKPKVGGTKNSYANDTVPKDLESGGIILPRSVTQAKDAPDKAAAFVRAILAKSGQPNLKKKNNV